MLVLESSALESGASACLVLISQPMLVLESSALESGASAWEGGQSSAYI